MSLPVVRLAVAGPDRVVAVSEPRDASLTLYTFLKGVPSATECEVEFGDFCRRLQGSNAGDMLHRRSRLGAALQAESCGHAVFSEPPPRGLHPFVHAGEPSTAGDQRRRRMLLEFFTGPGEASSSPARTASVSRESARTSSAPHTHHSPQPLLAQRQSPGARSVSDSVASSPPERREASKGPSPLTIHGAEGGETSASHYLLRAIDAARDGVAAHRPSPKDRAAMSGARAVQSQAHDLLCRVAAVSHDTSAPAARGVADALVQRLRSLMVFAQLQQHEKDTLKLADAGLMLECQAMKQQLRDVVAALVRSEGRLTGTDASLPPSDSRYVAEHCLFEDIQEILNSAAATS